MGEERTDHRPEEAVAVTYRQTDKWGGKDSDVLGLNLQPQGRRSAWGGRNRPRQTQRLGACVT